MHDSTPLMDQDQQYGQSVALIRPGRDEIFELHAGRVTSAITLKRSCRDDEAVLAELAERRVDLFIDLRQLDQRLAMRE
jgi:hypothetical protein